MSFYKLQLTSEGTTVKILTVFTWLRKNEKVLKNIFYSFLHLNP